MTFLAPIWLAAAGLVALGVIVAHLFSTSVPPRDVLPTVRFIPEGAPLAVLRTKRVSDLVLLFLRLLAVTLFGLALAGAHVRRDGPRRIVLLDVSRATASVAEVRDSLLAIGDDGATVIMFDSTARPVTPDSLTRMASGGVRGARGSLSTALVAAHRSMADASTDRDKTELVLVSPLVHEEVDSATQALLALWQGPLRVARVAAASVPRRVGWDIRANGDDPVAASLASLPRPSDRAGVRVVRTQPTRADSAWVRDSAGILVLWQAMGEPRAESREPTISGFASKRVTTIGSFARESPPASGRAVIRWIDGTPAATEIALGTGCIRDVAIPVDPVGDIALRESFRTTAASLLEPCGGARDFRPATSILSREAMDFRPADGQQTPRSARNDGGVPLLLALAALAVLFGEQVLRRRRVVPA
jgi:hypothetical protein